MLPLCLYMVQLVASIRPAIGRVPFPPKRINVAENNAMIHERQNLLQKFLRYVSSVVTVNSLHPSSVRIQLALQQFLLVEERVPTIQLLEKQPIIPWRNVVQSFVFGVCQMRVMDKVFNGFIDVFMDNWEDSVDNTVWTMAKAMDVVDNMRMFMDQLQTVLCDGITSDCVSILQEFLLRSPSPNRTLGSLLRKSEAETAADAAAAAADADSSRQSSRRNSAVQRALSADDGDDLSSASPASRFSQSHQTPSPRHTITTNFDDNEEIKVREEGELEESKIERRTEEEESKSCKQVSGSQKANNEVLSTPNVIKRTWTESDSDSDDDIVRSSDYARVTELFVNKSNSGGASTTSDAKKLPRDLASMHELELDTFSATVINDLADADDTNHDNIDDLPMPRHLSKTMYRNQDRLSLGMSPEVGKGLTPPKSGSSSTKSAIVTVSSTVALAEDEMRTIVRDAIRRQLEIEVYVACAIRLRTVLEIAHKKQQRDLTQKISIFRTKPQSFFGIPAEHHSPTNWKEVVQALSAVPSHTLPLDRLQSLLDCAKSVPKVFSREHPTYQKPLGADDFLPIFIYILVHVTIPNLLALNVELQNLCDREKRMSEVGYYLATFEASITHISEGNANTGWPTHYSANSNMGLHTPGSATMKHGGSASMSVYYDADNSSKDESDDSPNHNNQRNYYVANNQNAVNVLHNILASQDHSHGKDVFEDSESDNMEANEDTDLSPRTSDAMYERPSNMRASTLMNARPSTFASKPESAYGHASSDVNRPGVPASGHALKAHVTGRRGQDEEEEESKSPAPGHADEGKEDIPDDDSDPDDWQQWAEKD
jgi:hypothetical protein